MKPVAGRRPDERNQLVRVAEFADVRSAGGRISAQCDQVSDTLCAIRCKGRSNALARRTDAGDMRRRALARGLNFQHRRQGAISGRAARAEGHRKELGPQLRQLLPCGAQFGHTLRCCGREELEAEDAIGCGRHCRPSQYGLSAAYMVALTGVATPKSWPMRATAPDSHGASKRRPASKSCSIDDFIVAGSESAKVICCATKSASSATLRARPTSQASRIAASNVARISA